MAEPFELTPERVAKLTPELHVEGTRRWSAMNVGPCRMVLRGPGAFRVLEAFRQALADHHAPPKAHDAQTEARNAALREAIYALRAMMEDG